MPPNSNLPAIEGEFGRRLFLLSLALSAVAFCACSLLIPVLIAELDDLNEFAQKEGKIFKEMADGIWLDLMFLQGRPKSPHRIIQLEAKRPERELRMSPAEIEHFKDRLERKSFKGRQRMRQMGGMGMGMGMPPRARAWTFAAQTYEETMPSIEPAKSANKEIPINSVPNPGASANFNGKCPPGPPGQPGLPGIDGESGQNGVPGKVGKSGEEVGREFEEEMCIKCPAGLPGVVGPPGIPGQPGDIGSPGLPGIAPQNSLPGPPGPIGWPGIDGVNGSEGVGGLPGVPGIKYSKGVPGPKGVLGLVGEPGLIGENGPDGEPGVPGEPGWPGPPGLQGQEGLAGPIGPDGVSGIPGIENHYCNCPVRTSQLLKLKDQPGGVNAFLGRWKGRLPNQLLEDYEKFVKEKQAELKIKPPLIEIQN